MQDNIQPQSAAEMLKDCLEEYEMGKTYRDKMGDIFVSLVLDGQNQAHDIHSGAATAEEIEERARKSVEFAMERAEEIDDEFAGTATFRRNKVSDVLSQNEQGALCNEIERFLKNVVLWANKDDEAMTLVDIIADAGEIDYEEARTYLSVITDDLYAEIEDMKIID